MSTKEFIWLIKGSAICSVFNTLLVLVMWWVANGIIPLFFVAVGTGTFLFFVIYIIWFGRDVLDQAAKRNKLL